MDDEQLLREFADSGSETAFRALVQRHLGMVLAVALRRTGSHNTAREIAQAVFTVLAQKARRLDSRINLTGWLIGPRCSNAPRFTARNRHGHKR